MATNNGLRSLSKELGFDACGVAAAGACDPEDRLGAWLARGCHAGMDWMVRTKGVRQDIEQMLPGVRSVVVVARNYYAPRPAASEGTGRVSRYAWGRVARYAWGRDYHRALRKPLRRLADHIASLEEGGRCACCIDSGPVLEKFWAALAGVGWIGKNSLVLRKDLGSWFFLGVILTTVELAPDEPISDQCGECRACIEACPTGAIVEPRVVDANRCISYHTIENRGEVPRELAREFGDWVFGCDICQEVCPWNREVQTTTETDFLPREGHANPDLTELRSMDEETFRATFAGSPIMRAKQSGIARNARITAGNQGMG